MCFWCSCKQYVGVKSIQIVFAKWPEAIMFCWKENNCLWWRLTVLLMRAPGLLTLLLSARFLFCTRQGNFSTQLQILTQQGWAPSGRIDWRIVFRFVLGTVPWTECRGIAQRDFVVLTSSACSANLRFPSSSRERATVRHKKQNRRCTQVFVVPRTIYQTLPAHLTL